MLQIVVLGILCHDRNRHDEGNVIRSLLRKDVVAGQLPEVGKTGSLYRMLYASGTAVVSRHREVPVAKFGIKVAQVARRSPGGFGGIHTVVGVGSLIQPVLLSPKLDELPHSNRSLVGTRPRHETGLGLSQVDQLLRYAFLIQNALD